MVATGAGYRAGPTSAAAARSVSRVEANARYFQYFLYFILSLQVAMADLPRE